MAISRWVFGLAAGALAAIPLLRNGNPPTTGVTHGAISDQVRSRLAASSTQRGRGDDGNRKSGPVFESAKKKQSPVRPGRAQWKPECIP